MDDSSARAPTPEDLARLCKALNAAGAKYIVLGGMAVNYWGHHRATEDIDLLVDPAVDNMRKVKHGMEALQDKAIREVADTDVEEYTVVRVVDEITVDLMARIGDVVFDNAESVVVVINGVAAIPGARGEGPPACQGCGRSPRFSPSNDIAPAPATATTPISTKRPQPYATQSEPLHTITNTG